MSWVFLFIILLVKDTQMLLRLIDHLRVICSKVTSITDCGCLFLGPAKTVSFHFLFRSRRDSVFWQCWCDNDVLLIKDESGLKKSAGFCSWCFLKAMGWIFHTLAKVYELQWSYLYWLGIWCLPYASFKDVLKTNQTKTTNNQKKKTSKKGKKYREKQSVGSTFESCFIGHLCRCKTSGECVFSEYFTFNKLMSHSETFTH